ncbi:hypothetical protein evm_003590 [Chilo suppressalis]|nr:hypothetical protein evm_003590 [Chilo suppressalis]
MGNKTKRFLGKRKRKILENMAKARANRQKKYSIEEQSSKPNDALNYGDADHDIVSSLIEDFVVAENKLQSTVEELNDIQEFEIDVEANVSTMNSCTTSLGESYDMTINHAALTGAMLIGCGRTNLNFGKLIIPTTTGTFKSKASSISVKKMCVCLRCFGTGIRCKDQKITRDDVFWTTKMEPKLLEFYNKCLLPELIDLRKNRHHPRWAGAGGANEVRALASRPPRRRVPAAVRGNAARLGLPFRNLKNPGNKPNISIKVRTLSHKMETLPTQLQRYGRHQSIDPRIMKIMTNYKAEQSQD